MVTDRSCVEGVDLLEEPALEGKGQVVFRRHAALQLPRQPRGARHQDPPDRCRGRASRSPSPWRPPGIAQEIGFQTAAVQKKPAERTVRLVIARRLDAGRGQRRPRRATSCQEIPLGSSTSSPCAASRPSRATRSRRSASASPRRSRRRWPRRTSASSPRCAFRRPPTATSSSITGDVPAGPAYKLTIGKGMPATDDAVLREEYTRGRPPPRPRAHRRLPEPGDVPLRLRQPHAWRSRRVNVARVRMTIDRVYLNNLFFLFQYGGFFDGETTATSATRCSTPSATASRETTLDRAAGRRNQRKVQTPLDLDRYVRPRGRRGLYRVSVGKPDDWEAAPALAAAHRPGRRGQARPRASCWSGCLGARPGGGRRRQASP